MKKSTTQSNPQIKKLYIRIKKTASQLDKMLLQMSRLISKEKKGKKKRYH